MQFSWKKILSLGVLALMAMGFGASVAPTCDAVAADATSQRLIAKGDIGDGTSPTRKG